MGHNSTLNHILSACSKCYIILRNVIACCSLNSVLQIQKLLSCELPLSAALHRTVCTSVSQCCCLPTDNLSSPKLQKNAAFEFRDKLPAHVARLVTAEVGMIL